MREVIFLRTLSDDRDYAPQVWGQEVLLPLPTPSLPLPPGLADRSAERSRRSLAALNRDAAARVALIGLTPAEDRADAARSAASWMEQAVASLPQAGDYYTAYQRALLDDWRLALTDYAQGQGNLTHVRATSKANSDLCAEISRRLEETGDAGDQQPEEGDQ